AEPAALVLDSLESDRDTGETGEPLDHLLLRRRGAAWLASVDGEGGQHASVGGAHGGRPARAQAEGQREMSIVGPQRIVAEVGNDHGLIAIGGRAARTGRGTDAGAADRLDIGGGQAWPGPVPQASTVRTQQ